jgi:hypothetical protein
VKRQERNGNGIGRGPLPDWDDHAWNDFLEVLLTDHPDWCSDRGHYFAPASDDHPLGDLECVVCGEVVRADEAQEMKRADRLIRRTIEPGLVEQLRTGKEN